MLEENMLEENMLEEEMLEDEAEEGEVNSEPKYEVLCRSRTQKR